MLLLIQYKWELWFTTVPYFSFATENASDQEQQIPKPWGNTEISETDLIVKSLNHAPATDCNCNRTKIPYGNQKHRNGIPYSQIVVYHKNKQYTILEHKYVQLPCFMAFKGDKFFWRSLHFEKTIHGLVSTSSSQVGWQFLLTSSNCQGTGRHPHPLYPL